MPGPAAPRRDRHLLRCEHSRRTRGARPEARTATARGRCHRGMSRTLVRGPAAPAIALVPLTPPPPDALGGVLARVAAGEGETHGLPAVGVGLAEGEPIGQRLLAGTVEVHLDLVARLVVEARLGVGTGDVGVDVHDEDRRQLGAVNASTGPRPGWTTPAVHSLSPAADFGAATGPPSVTGIAPDPSPGPGFAFTGTGNQARPARSSHTVMVSVPAGTIRPMPEAGRSAVACVLGRLPTVLPPHRSRQTTHVVPHHHARNEEAGRRRPRSLTGVAGLVLPPRPSRPSCVR